MDPIRFTTLGSGSALPNMSRFHASHLLEMRGKQFLIDCGEGAQIKLRQIAGKYPRLNHIFISHLHGDHCLGLMGVISSFDMLGRESDLNIYSPPPLESLLRPMIDFFCPKSRFNVIFHHFSPYRSSVIYEDEHLIVRTIPLKHCAPTSGFLFEEKASDRHLIREMIDAFQVPVAELKSIKKGADFIDKEGHVVPNSKLTESPDPLRKFAYCSDTAYSEKIISYIEGVDCLYHEATFSESEKQRAKETFHSTASQAATIAKKSHAGKLIIGHFSARYKQVEPLLQEAKTIFEESYLAADGATFIF